MKTRAMAIFLVGALLLSTKGFSESDSRAMVALPEPMKIHMLQNMRGHLVVLDRLLKLLADGDLDQASALAESELGMSSLNKHGAAHIAPYYPAGMRTAGTLMHKSASQFSRIAEEGDTQAAYGALGRITSACVACHAGYRVH